MSITRRLFVRIVPGLGVFALPSAPLASSAQPASPDGWPPPPPGPGAPPDESFPSHHPYLAKEMVTVAHFDAERVKTLLSGRPALAKASWDWGYGDWETALGAASHVGNRTIAQLLLDHGAPPTLFSAAMLGQTDVVSAWLAAVPEARHARGPHGIPLLAHAKAGGEQARAVLEYLQSLGPERPAASQPLTAEERASLEGEYTFGNRARDRFVVESQQNQLGIARTGAARRGLIHLGDLTFHPVGAPQVKIKFERAERGIAALAVFDPDQIVRAPRR